MFQKTSGTHLQNASLFFIFIGVIKFFKDPWVFAGMCFGLFSVNGKPFGCCSRKCELIEGWWLLILYYIICRGLETIFSNIYIFFFPSICGKNGERGEKDFSKHGSWKQDLGLKILIHLLGQPEDYMRRPALHLISWYHLLLSHFSDFSVEITQELFKTFW